MKLSKSYIFLIYRYLKKRVQENIESKNINSALKFIELSAKTAYNFNFIYNDDELESSLAKISSLLNLPKFDSITPQKGKYVLIDTCGTDNHGLTQQYIRAFISAKVEFAYIYEDINLEKIKIILNELEGYPKATIFTFDQNYNLVKRIELIYSFLTEYKPEKYFMHIMPWDVVAIVICNLLSGVDRFNINATDHAFWLGSSCIDYCIEFRDYGFTVSKEMRGLDTNQLLIHPYYPILNNLPFKGFPKSISKDSVILFSGGAYYKVYGEDGQYFKLVKNILDEYPDTVLLFAGNGDDRVFRKFIAQNKFENRIYLLGSRNDIVEVFKNCDIYLATYPITGGLMGQFAATIGKPILSFSDKKLPTNLMESFICHREKYNITFTNLELFYKHARNLISNKEFRLREGLKLKKTIIEEIQFNLEFKNILNHNKSVRKGNLENINYYDFEKIYFEVENEFGQNFQKLLFLNLRLTTIFFPKVVFNIILLSINKLISRLFKISQKLSHEKNY